MNEIIKKRIALLEKKLEEFNELIEFSKKASNDVGYAKWFGSKLMVLSEIGFLRRLINEDSQV